MENPSEILKRDRSNNLIKEISKSTSHKDLILEKRTPKQTKLKEKSKPSPAKLNTQGNSPCLKDGVKILHKRKKEQELEWKQKCDKTKQRYDSLFDVLSANLK